MRKAVRTWKERGGGGLDFKGWGSGVQFSYGGMSSNTLNLFIRTLDTGISIENKDSVYRIGILHLGRARNGCF